MSAARPPTGEAGGAATGGALPGSRGVRLLRVAGIDVYLDWSLLVIFALISTALGAGLFPAWHPQWSPALHWLTAVTAAVLFLVSVLVHELSHALVGRAQGMAIRRITLFIFGGMAHLEDEPANWRIEFTMAIVGPLTSLAIGLGCLWAAALGSTGSVDAIATDPQAAMSALGPVSTLLYWLGPVNVLLALFNLVPGFPLDGGRVMRAVIWGATGDLRRATRQASAAGRAFAWVLIAAGVAMSLGVHLPLFGTGIVNGLWLALIGWFLHNAALASYRQLLVRETLGGVTVAQLMRTDVESVAPGLSVRELIEGHIFRSGQRAYPVTGAQRLEGMISLEDVRRVPRAEWDGTPVARLMTPADAIVTVGPGESALQAMTLMAQRGVNQLPVVEGGNVRGLVSREDFLRWLALYGGEADADGS